MRLLDLLRGGADPEDDDDVASKFSLEGTRTGFIDRRLPRRAGPFVAVSIAIPLCVWALALLLARDRARFLRSADWLAQPLYFTVHLVVLRLFVTTYTRHFLAGVEHLDLGEGDALRSVARLLGPRGIFAACAVAAPFIWLDLVHLSGKTFLEGPDAQGSVGHIAASDHLLALLWSVEWVINAYVWVLLVGFSFLTIRTLEKHRFKAPLEIMLHEQHYRPFLRMSSQGASILLAYTAATAAYVFLSKGETTDYIRLWLTAGLLLMSFVPPWVRLKARVARDVREETHRLAARVFAARRNLEAVDDHKPPVTMEELGARVDVALSILEIEHLESLYRDLGRSEGKAILLRLLAPLSTVVMKVLRPG